MYTYTHTHARAHSAPRAREREREREGIPAEVNLQQRSAGVVQDAVVDERKGSTHGRAWVGIYYRIALHTHTVSERGRAGRQAGMQAGGQAGRHQHSPA